MSSQRHDVRPVTIADRITVSPHDPLCIIAGPCVLEAVETSLVIGRTVADACQSLGMSYIFKASFDKANRSSITSPRGPGLTEGLKQLAAIKSELGIPITTDIHEPGQADAVAEVADILQIPAFLSRQTDLLVAAAKTGKPVNVKKGQFMAPAEMRHVINKLQEAGCEQIILTERGTFFGYHRLVNDMIGVGDLMDLGWPVCFDATHSTQLPGAAATTTAGRPERGPLLARAAVAAGTDCVFLECHPEPATALSDSSNMLTLADVPSLLTMLKAIHDAVHA
ncbi:MAG: 3-deoxy-8-phosphooctulonate synthase [Planctomycetes bacterium]|nr:3-deoxy-8-phosphooctulonate synthase [Planctomycetota bacterium]NOG55890.1 3-deoxy-8-phosphooctulonate synthase [Planctomycetota bacterium]